MGISPIEQSGMVTRTQDYTTLKHNQDQKGMIDHTNAQFQMNKEVDAKLNQVREGDNADKLKDKSDAKEKGSGSYTGDGGKQRKKEVEKQTEGKVVLKGQSRFDIKI